MAQGCAENLVRPQGLNCLKLRSRHEETTIFQDMLRTFFPTNTFSAGEIEKDLFFSKQCFVGKNLHLFKEKLRNFQT